MPEELLDNPSNPVNQQPSPIQQPSFQGVNPVESQSYKKNIEPPQSLVNDYDTIIHQPYQPADIQPIVASPQVPKVDQTDIHDKPKNKKKIFFGALISLAVLLVSSSSSFALVSWYQNPQKVITDSLINMLTTRVPVYTGSVKFTSDNIKISVDLTAKQDNFTAGSFTANATANIYNKNYAINSDTLIDHNGDLYIKLQNLSDVVTVAETSFGITSDSPTAISIDKLVKKIDGTWIKATTDDLKQYSTDASSAKSCLSDAIKKLNTDKTVSTELYNVYQKNQFITVDKSLGQKDSSLGYTIKIDKAASKSFTQDAAKTKIYKLLHDCDNSIVPNTDTIDAAAENTSTSTNSVELWSNMFTHQVTKIVASSTNQDKSSIVATFTPQYSQKAKITTPTSSITVAQLQSYIQELTQTIQSGMSTATSEL